MEKHLPEHPLPEAIRQMARDETICKFCGVSYLIHNEIKALEDKLAAVEAELKNLRGEYYVLKHKKIFGWNKTVVYTNKFERLLGE